MVNTSGRIIAKSLAFENRLNTDDQGLVRREAIETAGIAKAVDSVRRFNHQLVVDGQVLCIDCNGPIPLRRLEALPNATRCRGCQEAVEEDPTAGF